MDDVYINRLNNAVKFLQDKMTFQVGSFVLGMTSKNTIYVNCYSDYQHLNNIPKEEAIKELSQKKEIFISNITEAKEFLSFIKDKTIEYNLIFDTGSESGIILCKEINGIIKSI